MLDVIVTGTGRCGLTAVMQMLDAGGMTPAGTFPAYEDVIDAMNGDGLDEAVDAGENRAIKCVDPRNYLRAFERAMIRSAGVIVMYRSPAEQAKSQIKFLQETGDLMRGDVHRDSIKRMAASNLRDQKDLMERTNGCHRLAISFESLIAKPKLVAGCIREFVLKHTFLVGFDAERAARQIRERFSACRKGLLEHELIRTGRLLD